MDIGVNLGPEWLKGSKLPFTENSPQVPPLLALGEFSLNINVSKEKSMPEVRVPRIKVHRVHEVEERFDSPVHSHVYVPRSMLKWAEPKEATAISVPSSSMLYGATEHFRVYYDRQLGTDGPRIADAILKSCEDDYTTLQNFFNGPVPSDFLPFKIRLTADSTGASHASCNATILYIGAYSGPGVDISFIRSLVIAEEDEVFEAVSGHEWDCGASNGEGLSRVLADAMLPGVEPLNFMSASVWLNSQRPDFVNQTDPTDRNYVSIGCSVLFLNWLHFQLDYSWQDIIRAGGPTLADTYRRLTSSNANGWQQFSDLMQEHYPLGIHVELGTDNPFPLPL